MTVAYSGTPDYTASSGDTDVTVLIAPTTLTYSGDSTGTVGEPIPVRARLLVDPIAVVGMPLTFTLGGLTCQAMTDANGIAACEITPTAVSQSGTLTASFGGTASYAPSQSTASIAISQSATAVTVTGPTGTAPEGTPVTIIATVGPTDGPGTVTFRNGGQTLCVDVPLTLIAEVWTATCTTDAPPTGHNAVTVSYSGNDNYVSADGALDLTVAAAPASATPHEQGQTLADTGADPWTPIALGVLLLIMGLAAVRLGARRQRL